METERTLHVNIHNNTSTTTSSTKGRGLNWSYIIIILLLAVISGMVYNQSKKGCLRVGTMKFCLPGNSPSTNETNYLEDQSKEKVIKKIENFDIQNVKDNSLVIHQKYNQVATELNDRSVQLLRQSIPDNSLQARATIIAKHYHEVFQQASKVAFCGFKLHLQSINFFKKMKSFINKIPHYTTYEELIEDEQDIRNFLTEILKGIDDVIAKAKLTETSAESALQESISFQKSVSALQIDLENDKGWNFYAKSFCAATALTTAINPIGGIALAGLCFGIEFKRELALNHKLSELETFYPETLVNINKLKDIRGKLDGYIHHIHDMRDDLVAKKNDQETKGLPVVAELHGKISQTDKKTLKKFAKILSKIYEKDLESAEKFEEKTFAK